MPLYFFLGAKIRFLFELSKTFRKFSFFSRERNRSFVFLLSCVPMVASGRAERFGAKNEALFSYFLWRRERSKETSTLTKPSPIWEGCN